MIRPPHTTAQPPSPSPHCGPVGQSNFFWKKGVPFIFWAAVVLLSPPELALGDHLSKPQVLNVGHPPLGPKDCKKNNNNQENLKWKEEKKNWWKSLHVWIKIGFLTYSLPVPAEQGIWGGRGNRLCTLISILQWLWERNEGKQGQDMFPTRSEALHHHTPKAFGVTTRWSFWWLQDC